MTPVGRRQAVVILAVGAVVALLLGLGHRRSSRVDEAPRADPFDALAPIQPAPSPPEAPNPPASGEAVDAGAPKSPLGAAAYYARRLHACDPPSKQPDANLPVKSFGRAEPGWGVRLDLSEDGSIVAAKLWGHAGKPQPCLTAAVASWPRAPGRQKAMTVEYPLHDMSYGRRPAGDVQLLATTIYDLSAFSPSIVQGDWRAICPRSDGAALIPALPTVRKTEVMESDTDWEVTSAACPGDRVVMVKGPGIAGGSGIIRAIDGGIREAGVSAAPDGEFDPDHLPTIATDRTKPINGSGTSLTFGDHQARLFVENENDDSDKQQLILTVGATAEVLIDEGSAYYLLWAGDLDGDGDIDLVVNSSEVVYDLFLSSHAGGHLRRHAASVVGDDPD
jgi:hypothetical protein